MSRWSLALALVGAAAGAKDAPFEYSYPPAARAIPKLRAQLDAEAAKARRAFLSEVAEERKDDPDTAGRLTSSTEWKVVADTPRFLSLSADVSSYDGGAHGNYGFGSLVWDRTAGVRREPVSFFAGKAALLAAVRAPFCAGLKAQREEKRGGSPSDGPSGVPEFDKCIDPVEDAVLLLGSANRRTFDRIGFQMAPYVAGPYSDGEYEVTLPVTPAILTAVRPEFRGYFAVKR